VPPAYATDSGQAALHTGGYEVHATIDPAMMTPEQRLAAVATILARGILCFHTSREWEPFDSGSACSVLLPSQSLALSPNEHHNAAQGAT